MIKKGVFLTLIIFLLTISIVFSQANTEYSQVGGESRDYNLGAGIFGSNVNFLSRGTGVSDALIPLVADLDGNGITEIILIDGGTVRLLNSSLATLDTISTGIEGTRSNPILFDIDGDGTREIIFGGDETEIIVFLNWNGTDLTEQSRVNYSNPAYHFVSTINTNTKGAIQIGCDSVQSCQIHMASANFRESAGKKNLTIVRFNESAIIDFNTIRTNTGDDSAEPYCSPNVRNIEIVDIDADGNKNYISTWAESSLSDYELIIVVTELDGTLTTGFPIVDEDLVNLGGNDCFQQFSIQVTGRTFSPPTVFPAQGGTEGGSESQIMVAFNTDIGGNVFKIKAFSASGIFIDDFPEVTTGDAQLVSTVARGNFFPDTQDIDFCA